MCVASSRGLGAPRIGRHVEAPVQHGHDGSKSLPHLIGDANVPHLHVAVGVHAARHQTARTIEATSGRIPSDGIEPERSDHVLVDLCPSEQED